MSHFLKELKRPAIAALLVAMLMMCGSSLAASGGRVGGRAFSSKSSSYSIPKTSYSSSSSSTPSSTSYFLYSSTPSESRSYSSDSSTPSEPRCYSSRPSTPYCSSETPFSGSTLFYIGIVIFAFLLVYGILSDRPNEDTFTATGKTSVLKLQVGLSGKARTFQSDLNQIAETADTSSSEGLSYVLTEVTLALLRHPDYCISGYSSVDVKKSLDDGEKCFNKLSIEERGKFDEETLVNVNNIRKKSTMTQRSSGLSNEYMVVAVKKHLDDGEKDFNKLSIEEWGKFDEETLVNVDNIRKKSTMTKRSTGFSNEYIVTTILVAADGVHNLPAITSSVELKEALQMLGSIPSGQIMAVEVLWTPQKENDTLSQQELLEDYPHLKPL